MGSTSFMGFACSNLLLVFLNSLFLGICIICFASVGTFSVFFLIYFFISLYLSLG